MTHEHVCELFDGASTYRVQLNDRFGFADAARIVPYLAHLGVSHLYCSPIMQAVPGSGHGYDVVSHTDISAELGGADGFRHLSETLRSHGMGLVVDVVPNHMGTASRLNQWWWEVLENGPSSPWAHFFDIDWNPPEAKLRQVVLVPVLGDHYGRELVAGNIRLVHDSASFRIAYFDREFPVSPRTLDELLADAAAHSRSALLDEIAAGFSRLPEATQLDRDSVARRHHEKQWLHERLRVSMQIQPSLATAVDEAVARVNDDPDRLDSLLRRQNYRLAWWTVAGSEADYRRFFDISDLVAVRVEDPEVFLASHALLLDLVADGTVVGLRVDHPDGLRDPHGYFEMLSHAAKGCWIVAEKILARHERLPADWPVHGTTGYDFANLAGGLFVDPQGETGITSFYEQFTGDTDSFERTSELARREVLEVSLSAELERITASLVDVCEQSWRYKDFTRSQLRSCLVEALVAFASYRTYIRPDRRRRDEDRAAVLAATATGRARRPDLDGELFDLLESTFLAGSASPAGNEVTLRFQQLSAALNAKGVEDTAFYRFTRLVALNEVGGEPSRFGTLPEEFHDHNSQIAASWPNTMLTTSTHDTKRSEDVRARLALISEIPDEWADSVRRWSGFADSLRRSQITDRRAEYLLFQTLVGAYPLSVERTMDYMRKALREAKLETSWTAPNDGYETAIGEMIDGLATHEAFQADLKRFVDRLAWPGQVNSLAQTVLKLTCPGVPDIFQGCESWNLSLVDPDNRRAVDFDMVSKLLAESDLRFQNPDSPGPLVEADRSLAKIYVTQRTLAVRSELREAFDADAGYRPLFATGSQANHLVAFERGRRVIALVPRLVIGLEAAGGWGSTTLDLPQGDWLDIFTGRSWSGALHLQDALESFPVALLTSTGTLR